MEESTTYQAILRRGEKLGAMEEAKKLVLRLGRRRLGPPTAEIEAAIQAIDDVERLERMFEAVIVATSWQELLATP